MLRLRICPHCQEEIRSRQAYFCHRCGAELPPPPKVEEKSQPEIVAQVKEKVSKKQMPVVVVATLVGAVLLAATVVAGVYYFQIRPSRSSLPSLPSVPKNEVYVPNTSFAVPNHPFSAKGLSEIVPADVDLYLESADPELLLPSLVSSDDWAKVETVLNEKVGLTPTEAASFLEDEFAVVQESTASAFLARVRDADFVVQKIAEVGEQAGWRAKMVNGFLVIANSPELIQKIEEAQKKLTLNLSLTPGFAEARQKLPPTGQIFYHGKKRLEFIPESLKGDAFVVSKKNEGSLVTGL